MLDAMGQGKELRSELRSPNVEGLVLIVESCFEYNYESLAITDVLDDPNDARAVTEFVLYIGEYFRVKFSEDETVDRPPSN